MYLQWQAFKSSRNFCNFLLIYDIMKKVIIIISLLAASFSSFAQDAASKMAEAVDKTQAETPAAEKPKYWKHSVKTQLNLGQTGLVNWAAGGYTTVNLRAYFDGNINYAKEKLTWDNRLQLDYGFLYSADKPIIQKSDDRIYLESKFGYEIAKKLYFSTAFNFRTQFAKGWDYLTPTQGTHYPDGADLNTLPYREKVGAWKDARALRSSFLAPGYTNLAVGIDYRPFKWLDINFSPLTGGLVICTLEELRAKYGVVDKDGAPLPSGVKFEFGAELKVNAKVNVNDVFSYQTQLVLFSNYLHKPQNLRVNWDNQISYKLSKYISLNLDTWLIYDPDILIPNAKDPSAAPVQKVQFKESVTLGLVYAF